MMKKFLLTLAMICALGMVTPFAQTPGKLNTTVYLTTAYTNATTTFSNVTGLSIPVGSGDSYRLSCVLTWQSSGTAGPKWQFTGPTNTFMQAGARLAKTATTASNVAVVAFASAMDDAVVVTTTTNFTDYVDMGVITTTAAGTIQLQAAAHAASTITVQPGSYCAVQ